MPARRRPAVNRYRRGVRLALFVAAAAAALAAAGPDALVPFRAVAGAAASEVEVAFVIDFGGSVHASVGCVKVPAGDNGYEALAAFTAQEHEQAPTYNNTGLLCSINDIPKSGCGQEVSDGYIYWSYWEAAAGKWQYANAGAFGAVTNGEIQGWRFQDPGRANPSDPPPTTPADFAAICAAGSSPTTTTTTTTTMPARPVGPSTTTTAVTTRPSPDTDPSVSAQGKSNGPGPTSTSSSGKGTPSSGAKGLAAHSTRTTDPPTKAPESKPVDGGSASSTSTSPGGGSHAQALSATAADDRSGGGDSAVPLIVGTLFILALLVVAVIRWRRRPGSP
jgi:hypothetical protein